MTGFLEVALEIGRELSRSAVDGRWSGDCIVGQSAGGHSVVRQDVGTDLYGGSAGIGLVLAHLSAATRDAACSRAALAALLAAVESAARSGNDTSLYAGSSGIALASVEAAAVLDSEDLQRAGARLAKQTANAALEINGAEVDLIGGVAGIIVAMLGVDGYLRSAGLRRAVGTLADRLVDKSDLGWWGRSIPAPSGLSLCGLAHGASGIGWALIEAGHRLDCERLAVAGAEVLAFEDGRFDSSRGSWPDLRSREADPTAEPDWMDAWCHGSLGIGAVRWHLWQSRPDPLKLAQATAAMWAARRFVVASAATGPSADMSLCHGLAGAAELMLLAFSVTGLDEHLRAARRVGQLILRLRDSNGGKWTAGLPGGSDVPGLMLGRAGLCALFLRLHEPSSMATPLLPGRRAFLRSISKSSAVGRVRHGVFREGPALSE